jgi:hypothetical protein
MTYDKQIFWVNIALGVAIAFVAVATFFGLPPMVRDVLAEIKKVWP